MCAAPFVTQQMDTSLLLYHVKYCGGACTSHIMLNYVQLLIFLIVMFWRIVIINSINCPSALVL